MKKQLSILEKEVEPTIMAEYKKKRNDNIFPVLVELENGNFCGRCRMEQPKVAHLTSSIHKHHHNHIEIYQDFLQQLFPFFHFSFILLLAFSIFYNNFLFNTLESIRMHSILKKEYVTAGMIEKLAVLERQYVDWHMHFLQM